LRSVSILLLFVVGSLAVGFLGGWATAPSIPTWYASLERPSFAPPNFVFGPVWTVLYLTIGVAGWRVWNTGPSRARSVTLILWYIQLGLNFSWSFIFFYLHMIEAALLEILVLLFFIVATTVGMRKVDRLASWLFVPYMAWVAFAVLLNFGFWWLNSAN
jgi:tryptophan-rich sensory protein